MPPKPPPAAAPAAPSPPSAPAAPPRPAFAAPPPPVDDDARTKGRMWVQAAGVRPDEVLHGSVHQVTVFGARYALYKTDDGEFYATVDSCPHAGGPLGEGALDGHEVTCPFHDWSFDVRDGSCTSGADLSVRTVEVRVEDDIVMLETNL